MEYINVRNNTSFPFQIKTFLDSTIADEVLQYHQSVVFDYVMKFPNMRGILLYHSMGSGKTILSISLCELFHRNYPTYKKIVLVQSALKDNMLKNKSKINVTVDDYTLISSNANNMIEQIDRQFVNLENTIVIVDEAHNLFNSILNGSMNGIKLYRKLMNAKNIKIIFLSGTLVVNDPAELGVCFNMLTGYINGTFTLFPEYYNTFQTYFVDNNNDDKFMSRIVGLVSYHEGKSDTVPIVEPLQLIYVEMSVEQNVQYDREKALEDEAVSFANSNAKQEPLVKKGTTTSTYRIHTRQMCNTLYPPTAYDEKRNEFGQVHMSRNFNKLTQEYYDNIAMYSPKFVKILEIIKSRNDQKGYVYSQFLDSGLLPFGKYLILNGYEEFSFDKSVTPTDARFAFITGDTESDVRDRIITAFNSKANSKGQLIKLLLMSAAVSQGISLHEMRYVIIMEPYWNWTRMAQVIGRGVRIDSHIDLPVEERIVTPYCVMSTLRPPNKSIPSTDQDLYERALKQQVNIDRFLNLVKRAAIDCSLNESVKSKCFLCKPTNIPLFVPDVHVDMKSPSSCEAWNVSNIEAESYELDGVTYHYNVDERGPHIYVWDDYLKLHKELTISDDKYMDVYEAVFQK